MRQLKKIIRDSENWFLPAILTDGSRRVHIKKEIDSLHRPVKWDTSPVKRNFLPDNCFTGYIGPTHLLSENLIRFCYEILRRCLWNTFMALLPISRVTSRKKLDSFHNSITSYLPSLRFTYDISLRIYFYLILQWPSGRCRERNMPVGPLLDYWLCDGKFSRDSNDTPIKGRRM